jgi:predicted DNA-binding transcriptional regulator YafY
MLQTSARLLRLLSLLLSQRYWSGGELSERLGVTDRTLRRDIDRLRRLGYWVDGQPGVAGGYALGAGTQLPPSPSRRTRHSPSPSRSERQGEASRPLSAKRRSGR